ncbi:MAG: hypothetical protein ACTJHT_15005 [Sphingobacterium sp.]|uniref:hypothetical protein n=1 Tax=Sphingobacterium sp. JB170 TaxID=1434842 RepID=UPI0015C68B1F|nr:hypothetical protein [Sphingobacterium sp. JB170]
MKKLFYVSILLGLIAVAKPAAAQVSVNINIGSQPTWGPSGYDYARYYYMPEIDVYYDVSSRHYVYLQGRNWVTHASLPRHYRGIDLYRTHKVVINDSYPWKKHKYHRSHYARHGRKSVNRGRHIRKAHHYDNHKRYSKDRGGKHYKKRHKKFKGKHKGHR